MVLPQRLVCGALVMVAASAWTAAGGAQDAVAPEERLSTANVPAISLTPEQEARAAAIEARLKCPVCRSQSIRQSRSFMAEDMKRRVRELVAEGRSDEEIRDYFVARYGEWILLTPPKSGFSLTAWALPLSAVALGVVLVTWVVRKRRGEAVEFEAEPLPERYVRQLDRELEETE